MFNNAYNNFYPYQAATTKSGIFPMLKGKVNWSNLLSNTQKTLNIINQAIPVFYQVKPIWNNTKTIFKIMGAIKEDDKKQGPSIAYKKPSFQTNNKQIQNNVYSNDNTPNFFL